MYRSSRSGQPANLPVGGSVGGRLVDRNLTNRALSVAQNTGYPALHALRQQ